MEAITGVMASGWLSLGPSLEAFEKAFSEYIGCRHAVAVNSGTSALDLILKSLGIKAGDKVITTPFSFIASSNAILFQDAIPVFVDIDPDTLNIDPEAIERKIEEIKRQDPNQPKAILAVDVFGYPADWEKIEAIAAKHDLKLIDDSCEALGASVKGRMAGTFGDAGAFGFYPNKQITTGEGGMITTDDEDLAEMCRILRNQGRSGDGWLSHTHLGVNYRLSDIACALGLAQIRRIDEILRKRDYIAELYSKRLADLDCLRLPSSPETGSRSWFVYVVFLEEGRTDRDQVLTTLGEAGIQASNYFPPIHLQPLYRERFGYSGGEFPVTESCARRSLALPFHGALGRKEIELVVDELESVLNSGYKTSNARAVSGESR